MRECQACKNCFADDVATCPNDGMPTTHTISGAPVLEGKYHLDCRLGQGGMGVVYKARHAYLKTQLAIKVILPDLVGNDPQLVTRFRQEALAAAAIRHQNVVGVTDYGVIDGTLPFLVMEFVEGESLHDLLAREKSLSPEHTLDLMSAICAGVGAAHHQGIVHRDLKPLNIMICSDKPSLAESVKILDFGLAKIKSGELLGSFIQAQTTGLMGSPYYMAPEQWADEDPDSRSDIYSLGVMLFQMLAGDVPFKGSSIPAIMKKHISDPAPSFADLGVMISPELERAVMHTLEKDPAKRTGSVDVLVKELREAIHPKPQTIQPTAGQSLPVSSLKIQSRPPKAKVFVDNVSVGQTRDNGLLLLDGIQSGNHHLRISHDGFQDWLGDVICDGKPQEVVAELKTRPPISEPAIPKPTSDAIPPIIASPVGDSVQTRLARPAAQGDVYARTINQNRDTGPVAIESKPAKKRLFSPLILGIIGLLGLFFVGIVVIGAAYMLGVFPGKGTVIGNQSNQVEPSPGGSPINPAKAEMILIPGGTFKMGRNDGNINERPEHAVKVNNFWMDKTEVTNAEYAQFVAETNHTAPKHWSNNRPLEKTEMKPVAFVTLEDAVAFAAWRSKRDGVTYRLPTEEEWEYAARNGAKGTLYPWGDGWVEGNAVVKVRDAEPTTVGSKPEGKNSQGVMDLIGNVWEWTSSELTAYPGSNVDIIKKPGRRIIVRGGSANEDPEKLKITSAFRVDVAADQTEKNIGFRLIRSR